MKKILLLVVLVAAVIGGIKGFIYYKVTDQLDEAIAILSPFAQISYEAVSSDLNGGVTVEGVKVKAYGNGLNVDIDEIAVKFLNIQTLLFIGDDLKKQKVPEEMSLSLRHVRMDLQSLKPYMTMLQAQSQQPFQDYSLLGCGELSKADPLKVLQQLGYSELDSSMNLGYSWDRASKNLTIKSAFSWHEMTGSEAIIDLGQVAALSAMAMMSEPELKRISVSLEDEGYNARLVEHCAASQDISGDDFIVLHMAMLRSALAEQGVQLGENLYEVYRYYLNSEGPLKFQMYPDSMQQLANMDMFKPSDLPALLGLEIHKGDEVIRDISFDWDEGKFKETMAALAPKRESVATEQKASKPSQPQAPQADYVEVNASKLDQQMNKMLRVKTSDNRRLEGVLKKVTDTRIFIDVPMGGGSATLPISIADISQVKAKFEPKAYQVAPIDR